MAGRPTDYKPEYNKQVIKLCKLGATDKELAEFFEVGERTINRWKIDHPEFCQSLKKGKVIADAEIANSLYKRAKGFTKKAKKFFQSEGKIIAEDYDEYYPPDTTAMIYWLKNRRANVDQKKGGQRWADKHELVHGGKTVLEVVRKPKGATDT